MYQYTLYGQNISSSLEFPQLCKGNDANVSDIHILEDGIPKSVLQKMDTQYYEIGEKESWFYNDTGKFYIVSGNEIHYVLEKDANIQYARTYILGYAMSMLLLQKGIMTIHCSAVMKDGHGVLFSGQSGAGKSTITTAYLNAGYKLIADDIVAVQKERDRGSMLLPAFPYQKLCRDALEREGIPVEGLQYIDDEKDKFMVSREEQFCRDTVEVKTMILLGIHEGEQVVVRTLNGLDKFVAIRENLFLKRLEGEWQKKPEVVQSCLKIASKLQVHMVSRPSNGDSTEEVKQKINELLSQTI